MKILTRLTEVLLMFALTSEVCAANSVSAKPITSIQQLNDPAYTIAVPDAGMPFEAVIRNLPKAKRIHLEGQNAYDAVKLGRADAYVAERRMMEIAISHGLKGVKILPGSIGESAEIIAGLSRVSKIPELREKINKFIAEIKADGTFDDMFRRWVIDENFTMPDIDLPDNSELTLRVGTAGIVMPFSYYTGNTLAGFDIELARRFAKWLGTSVEFKIYDFGGITAAAATGDIDCIMSNLFLVPEHKERIDFSDVLFTEDFALMVRDDSPDSARTKRFTKLSELNGKRIGVQTGVDEWAVIVRELLPDSPITFYNSTADLAAALEGRKIDAFPCDSPVLSLLMAHNKNITVLSELLEDSFDIAVALPKTEHGSLLKAQWDEFITSLKADGKIDALVSKWTSADDQAKTLEDYSSLPSPNGTLRMATEGEYPPFNYYRDNELAGFEVELAVEFCKAYGYGLEINAMAYDGIFAAVQSGRCDFAMDTLTPKEEHQELMLFSVPYYACSTQMAVLAETPQAEPANYTSIDDLAGKRIGVQAGTRSPEVVKKFIPTAKLVYYDSPSDNLLALRTGKIDAASFAEHTARIMMADNKDIDFLGDPLTNVEMAPIFPKTEKGRKLCEEYGGFVKTLRDNGTLKEIDSVWLGNDESKKVVRDYTKFPVITPKGRLRMAVDPNMLPFAYMKDNKIVGYDIDIAVRFCEAKGYSLEIVPMTFTALIPSVNTSKCDFSCSMTYTPERAESVLFSPTPNATSGSRIIIMKSAKNLSAAETPSFIDELKASFNRTFIREDRWRLFVEGIINTMIITVLSILCGTVLGFCVYLFCRGGNVITNLVTRFCVWLIQGMPMVVLLMILYYVVFGKVNINGLWVAVIAFSLTFGAGVYSMILAGVCALDKGQTEAAYALGFSDTQTFFTVILPQAALHFMPAYEAEISALIKATAIVGYIAVQDLTKMGDIVRSRTYEAFFPLIAVAVIYFVLAGILNMIVGFIHNRIRPEKRTRDKILRGIESVELE